MKLTLRQMFDMPPLWLLLACVIAWWQARNFTYGTSFGGMWADFAGGLLVGGGILLMLLAFMEFRTHKTSVVPHQDANALITSGIYNRSRNPIYLADMLILTGLILRWDAVLSLPLIPILFWVLETRFIVPEERRLLVSFGMQYQQYMDKTRRWV
ncbi:isoprenylcysteine carboxylmethyltransferase family protein [Nereida sp. MMG025]|uniref:methyltransferase family protein n=1 Tax=Nereida sp. MMG025 TaxID=2909981 RepID=UPI001F431E11|nr:isoprenylcysteine carboxylmethyltransferase family protein [Nereida sp. MMG025]MCF6445262.1 isoprenylcysteine carboxylmethyltransferase family protein [Nereida sp. MMG025]